MKLAMFHALCEDLYEQYEADPYELFLTPDSREELHDDITHGVITVYPVSNCIVDTVLNPVTGSVVDIRDSENDFDSVIVELTLA